MGRATQGVRLMELQPDEKIVSVAKLAERDEAAGTEVQPAAPTEADQETADELEVDAEDAPTAELEVDDGDAGDEPTEE